MTVSLPAPFTQIPVAHRAYHDISDGRPENSRAAMQAAIDAGYGIELDLQLSRDGVAMVFHDYGLSRLTGQDGTVGQKTAAELQRIPLLGGDETIPTLKEILALVAGQTHLLIEIKDQDGAMGPNVGALEAALTADLVGYDGVVAVMSFNPHSVAKMAELAPHVPRGITTCSYEQAGWPLNAQTRAHLRGIPDFERVGASFISHEAADLARDRVRELGASGVPVLTWTVTSQAQADEIAHLCDNITFEGYAAPLPT